MNRPTYWAWVAGLLATAFIIGFTFPHSDLTWVNGVSLIAMWIIGAQRMDDTKYSQWWGIFAPFLLGTIIIGCLPSKESNHEIRQ